MKILQVIYCLVCLSLPLPAVSANYDLITSAIAYIIKDNIKTVSFITCRGKYWSLKFAQSCANFSMKFKVCSIHELNREKSNALLCLREKYERLGVVIQASCDLFEETMLLASRNQYLDHRHKWLIYVDSYNFTYSNMHRVGRNLRKSDQKDINTTTADQIDIGGVERVLKPLNMSVNADITVFERIGISDFRLYDLYNYGKIQGGEIIQKELGSWRSHTGFSINNDGYKFYDRWDFDGLSIRMHAVVSAHYPSSLSVYCRPSPREHKDPNIPYKTTSQTTIPSKNPDIELLVGRRHSPAVADMTRTSASILRVIAETHNFRYNVTVAEIWFGNINRNSSTKNVLSGLHYGEQDITPVLRYLSEFSPYYDIIHPPVTTLETTPVGTLLRELPDLSTFRTKFYYRISTKGPGKYENKFLTPFSNGAWLCVVAMSCTCCVVLLLAAMFERRPSCLQYSIFSAISALCQQFFADNETSVRIHSTAQKLAIFITGLSSVLVYNYYTSSVVSWLLNGPPPSINSLTELLESPLELILEDIGYAKSWVQLPGVYYFDKRNAEVEDALRQRKIYSKKEGSLLYTSVEQGIEVVKAGGYAFHAEMQSANFEISKKFTQNELCELGSVQSMPKTLVYASVPKNSPYEEFFRWSLVRLTERGIVSCIQRRTRAQSLSCEGRSPRALTLGGAAPAFLLLAAGYLLAVLIMFMERYYYKSHTLKNRSLKNTKYRFQN